MTEDICLDGKYKVIITSGTQSAFPCPPDVQVTMVVYGEEGKTGDIILKPADTDGDPKAEFFKPGQTDTFEVG